MTSISDVRIPIQLSHYRRKQDAAFYLPALSDRDLIAAVILATTKRRRRFPSGLPGDREWLEANDAPLAEILDDIERRNAFHELDDARAEGGQQTVSPPPLPEERRLSAENISRWSLSLPRLRGLGELLIEERLSAEMEPEATSEATQAKDGGSGGGKKAKAKPAARPEANDDPETLIVSIEEAEEMGIPIFAPPMP